MPRKLPSPLGVRPLIKNTPRSDKELRSLIYSLAGPYCTKYIQMIHAICIGRRQAPPSVQLQALFWMAERCFGKAVQTNVNLDVDASSELAGMSNEEIAAQIAQLANGNPALAAALKRGLGPSPRRIIEAPGTREVGGKPS